MMGAQQQTAVKLPQEAEGRTPASPLSSPTTSTSAPQVQKSRASTTTVSSASAAPISSSQLSGSSSGSNTATSATATASVSQSATTPEIRQRRVGQHSARPPSQGQFQNAPTLSDQNVRQSEHPLVILLMVVLGIAILALLVRRVYMMNTWRFDTDF